MTVTLSGIISHQYDDDFCWNKIKLIQTDGYKIDLITRCQEITETYKNCKVQVNYWVCEKPMTRIELQEAFLHKISGAIQADYEQHDYRYSSWTSGTDYNTILKIGGHDLNLELLCEEGKFLMMDINIKKGA